MVWQFLSTSLPLTCYGVRKLKTSNFFQPTPALRSGFENCTYVQCTLRRCRRAVVTRNVDDIYLEIVTSIYKL